MSGWDVYIGLVEVCRPTFKCRWQHPGFPDWKKSMRKWAEHQHSWFSAPRLWMSYDQLPHMPDTRPSLWWWTASPSTVRPTLQPSPIFMHTPLVHMGSATHLCIWLPPAPGCPADQINYTALSQLTHLCAAESHLLTDVHIVAGEMARRVKVLTSKSYNLSSFPARRNKPTPESSLSQLYMCVCTHTNK